MDKVDKDRIGLAVSMLAVVVLSILFQAQING